VSYILSLSESQAFFLSLQQTLCSDHVQSSDMQCKWWGRQSSQQQLFCSCGSPVHTIIPLCRLSRLAWCCWCKRPRKMISCTFSCLPACSSICLSNCATSSTSSAKLVSQIITYHCKPPTSPPALGMDGGWMDG